MKWNVFAVITLFWLITESFASDTTVKYHKLMVGYDAGLSLRYYPVEKLGFGLVIHPKNGRNLYSNSEMERFEERITDITTYDDRSKGKGVAVLLDIIRKYHIGNRFTLSPFVSLEGGYLSSKRVSSYNAKSKSGESYENNNRYEYKTRSLKGQFGVMPGVFIGPFTIEFRLGMYGGISKTETPDNAKYSEKEDNQTFGLIYPGDIVQSLIVHVGF